jgi:hypothetical protein
MFRAGLYARVSTDDQQTLAMQNHAMLEYAAPRGWPIALQVLEVNSGAARRDATRARNYRTPPGNRRGADLAPGLGPFRNGSAGDLQELEHLSVSLVSLTEALDLTRLAVRAPSAGLPSA